MTTDGGAFAPAAARLKQLLGDGVEVYSPFYAATEGLLGVNVMPRRPYSVSTYVLEPGSMFFELLPLDWRFEADPPRDAPIPAWRAQVGEAYEIIVTTLGGLCRYRLGDVVRVHGMQGQMPIVSVEERAIHALPSLHGERVAEGVFYAALASTPWASQIRFAAVVDLPGTLDMSRYHVFAEPADGAGDAALNGADEALDAALCAEHEVYASFRRRDAIRRLQVHWVRRGTLVKLRQELAATSADLPPVGSGQIKVPCTLRGRCAELLVDAAR